MEILGDHEQDQQSNYAGCEAGGGAGAKEPSKIPARGERLEPRPGLQTGRHSHTSYMQKFCNELRGSDVCCLLSSDPTKLLSNQ